MQSPIEGLITYLEERGLISFDLNAVYHSNSVYVVAANNEHYEVLTDHCCVWLADHFRHDVIEIHEYHIEIRGETIIAFYDDEETLDIHHKALKGVEVCI